MRSMIDHKKVLILALNGPAIGAGAAWFPGIADLVLASSSSYLQCPFSALGLVPENGSVLSLGQHVGIHRANDFLMTGRKLRRPRGRGLGPRQPRLRRKGARLPGAGRGLLESTAGSQRRQVDDGSQAAAEPADPREANDGSRRCSGCSGGALRGRRAAAAVPGEETAAGGEEAESQTVIQSSVDWRSCANHVYWISLRLLYKRLYRFVTHKKCRCCGRN